MKTTPTVAAEFAKIATETLSSKELINDHFDASVTVAVTDLLKADITFALDDLMGEVYRQVRLERQQAQELRRRVRKMSPGRQDLIREQDAAIRHLDALLVRLKKVTA